MSEHRHIGPLFSAEEEDCLTHAQMMDYASGKISPLDKHQVERHLLNCDLCALAFEGISEADADTVAAGAEAITAQAWSRVAQLEKKRRRSAFMWMSSAAVILLLILVGFFVIDQQEEKKLGQLADSMFELPESPEDESTEYVAAEEPAKEVQDLKANLDGSQKLQEETYTLADASPPQPAINEAMEEVAVSKDRSNAAPMMDFRSRDVPELAPSMDFDMADMDEIAIEPKRERQENQEVAPAKPKSSPSSTGDGGKGLYRGGIATTDSAIANATDNLLVESDIQSQDGAFAWGADDEFAEVEAEESLDPSPVDAVTSRAYADNAPVSNGISKVEGLEKGKDKNFKQGTTLSTNKRTQNLGYDVGGAVADAPIEDGKVDQLLSGEYESTNKTDFYRKGLEAYENRDFQTGGRYLRQAATDTPQNLNAHLYAALCFIELGQYTAAQYHLDRIIAQQPNSLTEDAKWYKSIALLKMGKKKEAETLLREIEGQDGERKAKAKKALDDL